MKQPLIKNYDELPMFINAATLAQLFGVSRASAYELMSEKRFSVVQNRQTNSCDEGKASRMDRRSLEEGR